MPTLLPNLVDTRWYLPEFEQTRAIKVMDLCGQLWRNLEPTRMSMIRAARLYGNLPILGLSPRLYRQKQLTIRNRRIALNVIKSTVDTYVSILTKDRPKVTFLTSGGDWSLQRKAKLLEKFIDGQFYETDLHITAQAVSRDSALFGIGLVKVYSEETRKGPKICIERVLPWELLVDDQDASYGEPRCMYHVKFMDRRALMVKYPEHREELMMASTPMFDETGTNYQDQNDSIDLCAVVEAWALPLGNDEEGRHVIACGNVTLVDEPYTDEFFPFEVLYRQKPIQGIWGQSLADELEAIQVEIARILMNIQRSQMLAVGHWLVENNAKINTNAINDVVASIIRYSGMKPEYVAYQPVSNDVYSHLDRLWQRAFEVVGISQMTAQSQKPAGLNSGKAMLVYADVQSQRFQPCYREYQHWYLNLAHQIIHQARKISDSHPDFAVKATGKSMITAVKWADCCLDDEEYSLQLKPTNALADDPAAKLQIVQDMINAGMINPDDGRRLLDMPDLEQLNSLENAAYDVVMMSVERMIDEGEYFGPEPYMGPEYLQQAIHIVQMQYLKARLNFVPEDRLALLRRWMDEAADKLAPPAPPPEATAPGLPPGAPPPGPPGAPPGGPPGPGGPPPGLPMPPGAPTEQQRVGELVQREMARNTARNIA